MQQAYNVVEVEDVDEAEKEDAAAIVQSQNKRKRLYVGLLLIAHTLWGCGPPLQRYLFVLNRRQHYISFFFTKIMYHDIIYIPVYIWYTNIMHVLCYTCDNYCNI